MILNNHCQCTNVVCLYKLDSTPIRTYKVRVCGGDSQQTTKSLHSPSTRVEPVVGGVSLVGTILPSPPGGQVELCAQSSPR